MKIPEAKKQRSGMWRIQLMLDGERYSITEPTKKECVAKAAALKTGLEEAAKRKKKLTLADAIDGYITVKTPVLSPSTIREYRKIVKSRFPSIMGVDIYSLTQQQLQRAVAREAAKVSAKTVKNAYSLVHATLDYYHIHVGDITLPQVMRNDTAYLQMEEIPKFIAAAEGDFCELPALMALLMGMRRSEILGLCWDCVDLEHRRIVIRRALVQQADKQWILKETTKNSTSQRILDLDPSVYALMCRLTPGAPKDPVVHCHPATFGQHITAICERAGVTPTTPHGLRHTWAAMMACSGVDNRVIVKDGGWSKGYTLASVYDYVFEAERVEAKEKKAAFLSKIALNFALDDEENQ